MVLDFQRLWAMFHFPRLLRALSRIQRDVLSRHGRTPGDFEHFAERVENLFLEPTIIALEEYGVPLPLARKLEPYLPSANLDEALLILRLVDLDTIPLSTFERAILEDVQSSL